MYWSVRTVPDGQTFLCCFFRVWGLSLLFLYRKPMQNYNIFFIHGRNLVPNRTLEFMISDFSNTSVVITDDVRCMDGDVPPLSLTLVFVHVHNHMADERTYVKRDVVECFRYVVDEGVE